MLSVVVMELEIMNHEHKSLGLQVNWLKTKIQTTDASFPRASLCLWLGTMLKSSNRSHILVSMSITLGPVSRKRIASARNCMASIDKCSLKHCVRSQVTRLKLQKSFCDLDDGVSLWI